MTAFVEATVGPVAAIIRARNADHAVEMANDGEYGLGAVLGTADLDRARDLPRRCGSTSRINGTTAKDRAAAIGLQVHNCDDSVMVIEGKAIAGIDGVQHHPDSNDPTWRPANAPHRFMNATDKPMRIFWTHATIDATRTMVAPGETRSIDAEHGHAPQ